MIDIDEPSIVEGQSGTSSINFNVILSHLSATAVSVDWTTVAGNGRGRQRLRRQQRDREFAAMDDSETVSVIVKGDGTFEGDETFGVDLSNASGRADRRPGGDRDDRRTTTRRRSSPSPTASKTEGNTGTSLLTFAVSLAGDSDVDATLDWATASGTAAAGTDYVASSGTLTIPAGATTGTVNVVVNGDLAYEATRPFRWRSATRRAPRSGTGVPQGTILNDDKAPTAVTVGVVRKPRAVVAKGLLEPASSGERVTVTLFRKKGAKFVKVSAKTVLVRYLKDRDGDGKTDGSYTATLVRPKAKGSYKVVTQFKGTANYKPCLRGKDVHAARQVADSVSVPLLSMDPCTRLLLDHRTSVRYGSRLLRPHRSEAPVLPAPVQTTLAEAVPLREVPFIVVDLETTGGSPRDLEDHGDRRGPRHRWRARRHVPGPGQPPRDDPSVHLPADGDR